MTLKRVSTKRTPAPAAQESCVRRRIDIMIVDDHPLMRAGIIARLEGESDLHVCSEAADVASALRSIGKTTPDVAIVDLALKDSHGLELIKELRERSPRTHVLVLSAYSESLYGERVLRAGAHGFLNKQQAQTNLIEAIRAVAAGKRYVSDTLAERLVERAIGVRARDSLGVESLSDRELQVFECIGAGNSTRMIAEQLGLSIHTIETYRENIRQKLGLRNGTELVQHAVRWLIENR